MVTNSDRELSQKLGLDDIRGGRAPEAVLGIITRLSSSVGRNERARRGGRDEEGRARRFEWLDVLLPHIAGISAEGSADDGRNVHLLHEVLSHAPRIVRVRRVLFFTGDDRQVPSRSAVDTGQTTGVRD